MITFKLNADSAEIVYNKETVYTVRRGARLFDAGKGENSYKMSHGSFKIKETVKSRYPLVVNELKKDGKNLLIFLSHGKMTAEPVKNTIKFTYECNEPFNRMHITLPSDKNEHLYGGGELFTAFDLKGKALNVWVAEHINALSTAKKIVKQTVGIRDSKKIGEMSEYESYYAQPTFISSKKYFFHSLSRARCEFDFTKSDSLTITCDEIAPFYIGFADDFEKLSASLTSLIGRQPRLPEWVFDGQILGVQGGSDVMLQKVKTAKESGLDVCGVWIQDWEGRRVTAVGKQLMWNWRVDNALYPDLKQIIKQLGDEGVKVLGYINPFLAIEGDLYKEASAKGYCVKDNNGKDYLVKITTFPAAMVDFTNPDAYVWIKNIIKENMIGLGLCGWMADFGEYLPTDCVLFSGENPEIVHNTWPVIWAKINREAVEETGNLGKIMFFTRAGFSGSAKYSTMMWNGDNHVDFSLDYGLPSVIPAMLSLSVCGFGISHSDIGGYTTFMNLRRSEELYMRWCEMNAFSMLMRGHEGLNPDLNAQFDASKTVLAHGAKMSRIHKKLSPYLKQLDRENTEQGIPAVRPLFYYYMDRRDFEEKYEYLLGRDLLVAPVIERGAVSRRVYLPHDRWIELRTDCELEGGEYVVPAPLGNIPVFVRKDAPEDVRKMALSLFEE